MAHRADILWQKYVDVILSKLSTPPLACFPFCRKPVLPPSAYEVKKLSHVTLSPFTPLPCREPLASLGTSHEFHLTACQCIFAYSMRSLTFSSRLPKTYCHTLPNLESDRCCIAFNNDKAAEEDRSWGLSDPGDFAYT
ncbi:conserved hypothetical protein [Trichinella spiralis]|uniref:hypothetical protein n=1 Tax=Trichinella spiralis TaxID=6334 RepID=UPI0001EFD8F8|nr:conserved hypothetical protein [Trichinella spiralis]